MTAKLAVFSIVGGIVVMLLTGFVSNTPVMWVGATLFGYPFPWLIRMVLAPEYYPWRIDTLNFIVDVIIWSTIVFIAWFALARTRKKL
jgi:hypothetical protein